MSRQSRKNMIQEIEKKRGSKVIAYVTSDRRGLSAQIAGDVVPVVHEHILSLGKEPSLKLDFFIYSRGGRGHVPWTIVSMFREYSQKGSFSVLIPYRAHSAATVIALGADEVVMTKKAELSPIDITISSGPYNPKDEDTKKVLPVSVEDVTGYFSLLEKVGCERPDEKMKGFELVTNQVHPLVLGRVSRLLEETTQVALKLLSTRAKPFSEEENHEIVRRISEVYSHEHTISRTEAIRYIGLKQTKPAEEVGIADALWSLYEEYKELFRLDKPFTPEEYLVSNGLEEHTWTDLNLACVESLERFDIFRQGMRVRRLRQVPSQINLNLTNLHLPEINIPGLPPDITEQSVQMLIQQVVSSVLQQSLNNAVQIAVDQLIRSLPLARFERFPFDAKWRKEE